MWPGPHPPPWVTTGCVWEPEGPSSAQSLPRLVMGNTV